MIADSAERTDEWRWLRDRADPDVRSHLERENARTAEFLADTFELQQRLYEELKGRVDEDDVSAPARKQDWWYYTKTVRGLPYPVHCRRHDPERVLTAARVAGLAGTDGEQTVLDGNRLAGTNPYFALGVVNLSPDQAILAFATDTTGEERYTLQFRDVATGSPFDDRIADVHYGSAWAADNRSFFYVRTDPTRRPHQVCRHVLGDPPAADEVVFEEPDPRFHVEVGLTRSERYIVITCRAKSSTEVSFIAASCPDQVPRLIAPRREGVRYVVEDAVLPDLGEAWLILTNDDGAENYAVHAAAIANPDRSGWRPFIPHREDVVLEAFDTFSEHAVVVARVGGVRQLNVIRLADGSTRRIPQPEPWHSITSADSLEYEATTVRFGYTSLETPQSTVEWDLAKEARSVVWQQRVTGYDQSLYRSERTWATAPDGTEIPISLVYARRSVPARPLPCVLYAYGSYGVSTDPAFSPSLVGLLDRGFVFAIAHVRGGGELGPRWHDAGKLQQKKNSFHDFIACAEHLIRTGWTAPDRLIIRSRSAGGLLAGAVINMRPELFAAVVSEVPFVDCLNTMLDDELPLTVTEWEEWGNPLDDAEARAYIASYCPYGNVGDRPYPAVYATAAMSDPRVGFWEAAKWVARLRQRTTSGRPVLLKVDTAAGHGGPSSRYQACRDEAAVQAFMLRAVGLDASPRQGP